MKQRGEELTGSGRVAGVSRSSGGALERRLEDLLTAGVI